jgi:hypothetical protein
MVELVRASGWCEHPELVTEAAVESVLRSSPDLIRAWIGYSEDQRCSPAWFLVAPSDENPDRDGWAVGYLGDSRREQPQAFLDGYAACACFIHRVVETVGKGC